MPCACSPYADGVPNPPSEFQRLYSLLCGGNGLLTLLIDLVELSRKNSPTDAGVHLQAPTP